jgi:hypothetical protein
MLHYFRLLKDMYAARVFACKTRRKQEQNETRKWSNVKITLFYNGLVQCRLWFVGDSDGQIRAAQRR